MYMSPKLIPIVILVFYLASKIRALQVVNSVVEEYLQQAKAHTSYLLILADHHIIYVSKCTPKALCAKKYTNLKKVHSHR